MDSIDEALAERLADDQLEQLHPDGDVTLVVGSDLGEEREFSVSSTVLIIASDYFKAMFKSPFKEANEMQQGDHTRIHLHEDDPQALGIILSVLHFMNHSQFDNLDPETLSSIASASDKYHLTRALRPWIHRWLGVVRRKMNEHDLGLLLTSAYFFHDTENFKNISVTVIQRVSLNIGMEWSQNKIMSFLPKEITDELHDSVSQLLDSLYDEIQNVEGKLRTSGRSHEMPGRVCKSCGRVLPPEAKKCHPCRNSDLDQWYCTESSRIADYFAILRQRGLWPSLQPFRTGTATELARRVTLANQGCRHQCAARRDCPLFRELELLCQRVDQSLQNVKGLNLQHYVGS